MTNKELIELGKQVCSLQDMVVGNIGAVFVRVKDEDFKKRISQVLAYMDCDAYTDEVRIGFRRFAEELLNTIEQ